MTGRAKASPARGEVKRPALIRVEPYTARVKRGPREDGRWYWQVRFQQGSTVTNAYSAWATRDELREDIAKRIASGSMPATGPAEASTEPESHIAETVRDLLEFWIGHQEDRLKAKEIASRSMATYRCTAKRIADFIGELACRQVAQSTMSLLKERAGSEAHPQTLHHLCVTFNSAWTWGVRVGLVPSITLRTPQLPRIPRERRRVATMDEFWAAVDVTPMGWPKTMLMILGLTGCRTLEAARLRWSDFNAEPGSLRVGPHPDVGNDGGKHPRTIMIPEVLVTYLQEWRAQARPRSENATISGQRSRFTQLIWHRRIPWDEAGVEPLTGYDFRRMMSEAYMRAGVDPAVYETQMGHSYLLALRRYRQFSEQASLDALAAAGIGRRSDGSSDTGVGPKVGPKVGQEGPKNGKSGAGGGPAAKRGRLSR